MDERIPKRIFTVLRAFVLPLIWIKMISLLPDAFYDDGIISSTLVILLITAGAAHALWYVALWLCIMLNDLFPVELTEIVLGLRDRNRYDHSPVCFIELGILAIITVVMQIVTR